MAWRLGGPEAWRFGGPVGLMALGMEALWPGGPVGLEARQAWRPCGPGGLEDRRPCGPGFWGLGAWRPGGPWGLEALGAWKHCVPGGLGSVYYLKIYLYSNFHAQFKPSHSILEYIPASTSNLQIFSRLFASCLLFNSHRTVSNLYLFNHFYSIFTQFRI